MEKLPAPLQCQTYLDWNNGFINCCLKDKKEGKDSNEQNWRAWLNNISWLLSQVEGRIWDKETS